MRARRARKEDEGGSASAETLFARRRERPLAVSHSHSHSPRALSLYLELRARNQKVGLVVGVVCERLEEGGRRSREKREGGRALSRASSKPVGCPRPALSTRNPLKNPGNGATREPHRLNPRLAAGHGRCCGPGGRAACPTTGNGGEARVGGRGVRRRRRPSPLARCSAASPSAPAKAAAATTGKAAATTAATNTTTAATHPQQRRPRLPSCRRRHLLRLHPPVALGVGVASCRRRGAALFRAALACKSRAV